MILTSNTELGWKEEYIFHVPSPGGVVLICLYDIALAQCNEDFVHEISRIISKAGRLNVGSILSRRHNFVK